MDSSILQKQWNQKIYGRREMGEAAFSAIKRKFGCSVSSHSMCRMRADMYLRAIAHNLEMLIRVLFEQSRIFLVNL
jgi:transposase